MAFRAGWPHATCVFLTATAVANAGQFCALPLLGVYLLRDLHTGPAAAGLALTLYLVTAKGLPAVTGPLADGPRTCPVVIAGLAMRGSGFALMAAAANAITALIATVIAGAGGAFCDPGLSAMLARGNARNADRVMALRNTCLNLGAVAGPALGASLTPLTIRAPFAAAALLHVAAALLLRDTKTAGDHPRRPAPDHAAGPTPWRDRRFLVYLAATLPWWFAFAQLTAGLPLRGDSLGGSQLASIVAGVNGLTGAASLLLVRTVLPRSNPANTAALGLLLVGAGFAVTAIPHPTGLLTGVAVYSLGETFTLVSLDVVTVTHAGPARAGAYFGLAYLPWLIGGTMGNYTGAAVLGSSATTPWLAIAGLTSVAAFVLRAAVPAARHAGS
jgi:MFS transporter, DHA1 family, multidrug resistance protein